MCVHVYIYIYICIYSICLRNCVHARIQSPRVCKKSNKMIRCCIYVFVFMYII